jgi:hypothetical protein
MNATERLEALLDEKDEQIEELEKQLQELQDASERDWEWARHKTLKENPDNLPVPRLEIRWFKVSDDGYLQRWDYNLIYKHVCGHLVSIPLGQTNTQGGNGEPPIYNGEIRTPFRDGVHICNEAEQFNMPAFAICDGQIAKLSMLNGKCHQVPYPEKGS